MSIGYPDKYHPPKTQASTEEHTIQHIYQYFYQVGQGSNGKFSVESKTFYQMYQFGRLL